VAVRLDAGIVSDVIAIRVGDDGPVAPREAPVQPTVRDVDLPGDVHQVVPELLAEIRRRRSTSTPRSATRRNR
jgi:hypothetical protein